MKKKGIKPWQGWKNEAYNTRKRKLKKQLRKGYQPKDEEYPPLADNSKIGL